MATWHNGKRFECPEDLKTKRNQRNAYELGFMCGAAADPGGTPLHAYKRAAEARSFERGFADGQRAPVDPASRSGGGR